MLVHVLSRSASAYRKQARGMQTGRAFREIVNRGPPPGPAGFRRRLGGGLVPADAARCTALAGPLLAPETASMISRLVAVLSLCAYWLSTAGVTSTLIAAALKSRQAPEGARAGSVFRSIADESPSASGTGLQLNVCPRGIQHGRAPDTARPIMRHDLIRIKGT